MSDRTPHLLVPRLADEQITADLRCPHDGADLTGRAWDDLPDCRRRDDLPPLDHCNAVAWWADLGTEALRLPPGADGVITALPVPVSVRWEPFGGGGEDAAFYVEPVPPCPIHAGPCGDPDSCVTAYQAECAAHGLPLLDTGGDA